MLRNTLIFLSCIAVAGILAAGCSGGSDDADGKQAPSPSSKGVAETPKTDKNRPGDRATSGGEPGANGMSQQATKPAGM
jgi:hypothetical protein